MEFSAGAIAKVDPSSIKMDNHDKITQSISEQNETNNFRNNVQNQKTPFSLESTINEVDQKPYYKVVYDINPSDYKIKIDETNTTAGKTNESEKEKENKNNISSIEHCLGFEDNLTLDSTADQLIFELPQWGIEDYINDRTKWVKGIKAIGDEPGFFYVKTFFKFNTNYGLFGGVLSKNSSRLMSSNSALRYLNSIKGIYHTDENNKKNTMFYNQEQIPMRINALVKFVAGLSKINTHYPWMIKGVNGLENVMNVYTDNFTEEKSFELVFNTETTNMRLINLLNLYKYACFDDINCKEIIPANLRKFDMMVIIYHVPLKYFQTAIMVSHKKNLKTGMTKQGSKLAKAENIINSTVNFLTSKSSYYNYKKLNPDEGNYSNMMSFQMFTFQNCEFDVSSFGNYFSGAEIRNEQPFQFAEIPIKIKYDRVYYHNMNEWNQMLLGSDGFIYDVNFLSGSELNNIDEIKGGGKTNLFKGRLDSIKKAKDGSRFFDKNAAQYKSIIDYAESLITDGLMNMDMRDYYAFTKGNLYGMLTDSVSEYFANKTKVLKDGNIRGNISGKVMNRNEDKSGYFNKKLEMLKKGTIKGNIYGKEITKDYFDKKIKLMNDNDVNPGNIRQELNYAFDSLKDSAKIDNKKSNYAVNMHNIFSYITDYPYERDPIETQKKDIWNYILSGESRNGLFGGIVSDAENMLGFWKFR